MVDEKAAAAVVGVLVAAAPPVVASYECVIADDVLVVPNYKNNFIF